MKKERVDILKIGLSRWEVDLEAGTVKTRKGIASTIDKDGYVRIGVKHEGKYCNFGVHEVIAYAAGLDLDGKEVNHKDGNKQNNSISNLEAATRKENIVHSFKTGLNKGPKGSEHGRAILNEQQVAEIKEVLKTGGHGIGRQLAAKYGVSPATISQIKKGNLWNE
ncbi:HNH endonuclease signature motif containing protein [Bacillus sp. SRB3LM]|uniref:HNH endonuclease signature motif containing protein n=1 Tax=Bacillus sp. SRB3LM TaxID=2608689 RepID=UPI0018C403B1|nr:HNH endonuclease signature motif containing protein [Bacillus sp. SRB3LM]MBG0967565.1 hypothetical protein [Bacillus sp. SRB3LM]